MKSMAKRLTALLICVCLLLSGCTGLDFGSYFDNLLGMFGGVTGFAQMEYTRPDMDALEQQLQSICALAAEETNLYTLENGIWNFYEVYDSFSTAYALATIHYYRDLSNSQWEAEYNFCAQNAAAADAALDRLYRALAASPLRSQLEQDEYFGPGYFDYYDGESIYDETLLQLLGQEAELLERYHSLCADAAEVEQGSEAYYDLCGKPLAELFVELIRLRQQIAAYTGCQDYVQFAYDYYYSRDYTPAQTTSYLADIRSELAPLYQSHLQSDFWQQELPATTEAETLGYLSSMAQNMGGQIEVAYNALSAGKLYDIAPGEYKYNASFEIYISGYYSPFIFVNPMGNTFDHLTLCHEFGHFCSDYLSYGSLAGVDVAEVFSQSMEYLSLLYADAGKELQQVKLSDSLCLYVEQAALASFEQQVYGLTGEALTAENVQALYGEICEAYGIADEQWDSRDFVTVPHYFTNPMYIISYVVSKDAALQLYQLELEQKGAGVACLESNLATTHAQLLAFMEDAGLSSPFQTGRLTQVRLFLEQALELL